MVEWEQITVISGYSIKKNLTEIGCQGVDWINLAQNAIQWRTLVNRVMNLRIP
jgi:hypothetical protein